MAKQGMARPQRTHTQPRNDQPPVPELQGKAKRGKEPANPTPPAPPAPHMKLSPPDRGVCPGRPPPHGGGA